MNLFGVGWEEENISLRKGEVVSRNWSNWSNFGGKRVSFLFMLNSVWLGTQLNNFNIIPSPGKVATEKMAKTCPIIFSLMLFPFVQFLSTTYVAQSSNLFLWANLIPDVASLGWTHIYFSPILVPYSTNDAHIYDPGKIQSRGRGGGVLPYMGYTGMCRSTRYGFCLSKSGTGSANLSGAGYTFCHSDSGAQSGLLFASRIALQMNVAVPARVPLHAATCHLKVNRVSHFSVWNRVSIFTILSGTRHQNCVSLVWNRVRFPGTQRHTPILNWGEPPSPPGDPVSISSSKQLVRVTCDPSVVTHIMWAMYLPSPGLGLGFVKGLS